MSPLPTALSPLDQEKLPRFHFTSSSPNRPEGRSADRRRGICPGKRASHPHRPQLWERKQEGEQTNHDTAKSVTTSPLKCNNPVSVNNCLVPKHAKLWHNFCLCSCCSLCKDFLLYFFLENYILNLKHSSEILSPRKPSLSCIPKVTCSLLITALSTLNSKRLLSL